jgi:hypothetical protein
MSTSPYRYPEMSRRAVLQRLAATLVLGGVIPWQQVHALTQSEGIVRLKGKVLLNGLPALVGQLVKLGDALETFADAEVVFVVGKDAYLQRAGSRIRLESGSGSTFSQVLRVISGRILGVFAKGETQIQTPTVTLGIRGTGVYIEAFEEKTYVCLCYGTAEYTPSAQADQAFTQTAQHHDKPLWIYADSSRPLLEPAKPMNHSDAELTMLEALLGRVPPFMTNSQSSPYRY